MRLATYNVEWFDALFDDAGRPVLKGDAARRGVTRAEQWKALRAVFAALDADGVVVVEAPDTSRRRDGAAALMAFAEAAGIRARSVVMGFPNQTQQEIAFLFDPDAMAARHDAFESREAPRFDGAFRIDLDIDARQDRVAFSKPPMELEILAEGRRIRLIGAHLKSKAPHGARGEAELMRLALANRRKHLAQSIWLRRRVDEHLARGDALAVLGDFNDGPGLDAFEALFGRSGVEIVAGEGEGALTDPAFSVALAARLGAAPTSSRFLLPEGRYLSALLDYAMVSPALMAARPRWRIWHPLEDARIYADPALRQALLTASDHFPVTLDLELSHLPEISQA